MPVIPSMVQVSKLAPKFETLAQPAKHIALDIETGNADSDGLEISQRFAKAPSNIKDEEKAAAALDAKRLKLAQKSALLDAAPIACVVMVTESQQAVFYHKGQPWPKAMKQIKGIRGFEGEILCSADEREMLVGIRNWLDRRASPESIVIGHNLRDFDIPKLRIAYVRHRLQMPKVLAPEAKDLGVELYDTMKKFLWNFTVEKSGDQYVALEEMLVRLGIPQHKSHLHGEDVPNYVADGKALDVLTYCWADCVATYAAFRLLTGQYPEEAKH